MEDGCGGIKALEGGCGVCLKVGEEKGSERRMESEKASGKWVWSEVEGGCGVRSERWAGE